MSRSQEAFCRLGKSRPPESSRVTDSGSVVTVMRTDNTGPGMDTRQCVLNGSFRSCVPLSGAPCQR